MKNYRELDELQRDTLMEIGNIGTGNAVAALSRIVTKSFDVEMPAIRIVDYQEVPDLLGGPEVLETGIMLEISGDLSGMFLFLLNEEFTKCMLDGLIGEQDWDIVDMDEMGSSAICEVGNIMCGAYISALARLTDLKILVSVPDICCDMAGAILSVPTIHFASISNDIMMVENRFRIEEKCFNSHILFLPEPESLNKLFAILGV